MWSTCTFMRWPYVLNDPEIIDRCIDIFARYNTVSPVIYMHKKQSTPIFKYRCTGHRLLTLFICYIPLYCIHGYRFNIVNVCHFTLILIICRGKALRYVFIFCQNMPLLKFFFTYFQCRNCCLWCISVKLTSRRK